MNIGVFVVWNPRHSVRDGLVQNDRVRLHQLISARLSEAPYYKDNPGIHLPPYPPTVYEDIKTLKSSKVQISIRVLMTVDQVYKRVLTWSLMSTLPPSARPAYPRDRIWAHLQGPNIEYLNPNIDYSSSIGYICYDLIQIGYYIDILSNI